MSSTRPLGSHHSHRQPRRPNGEFVRYEDSGREAAHAALRSGRRLVISRGRVRAVRI
jgi:hypothetical protein